MPINSRGPNGWLEKCHDYGARAPALNQWGLSGSWDVGGESAVLAAAPGAIVFRFHARDLHLVLTPTNGKPVRFKVTLDGAAPGANAGGDTAPDGSGVVRQPRLYQLIRQNGQIGDRTFEIEFLDPACRPTCSRLARELGSRHHALDA